MIGRCAAILKNLNITMGLPAHTHEHIKKIFPGDLTRTTACDQDPARFEHRESQPVEPVVSL
jgi:hypothetical protein